MIVEVSMTQAGQAGQARKTRQARPTPEGRLTGGAWRGDRSTALVAVMVLVTLMASIALVALAPGEAGAYEHRRGTVSAGGQLQYGEMRGDSEWGNVFARDIGGVISVRQYVARNRAWGLTFELQKFKRSADWPKNVVGTTDADELQYQVLMADYYFYFRRVHKQCPYLVLSAGFYHPQLVYKYKDEQGDEYEEIEYPVDAFVARVGGGLEYFINRTVAVDARLSAYYVGRSGDSGQTISGQVALGVHLYVGN